MAKKKIGRARPGSAVTRKVTRGPGKGDTVHFKANRASAQEPGKLKPRRILTDVPPRGTQRTIPKGKKKRTRKKSS